MYSETSPHPSQKFLPYHLSFFSTGLQIRFRTEVCPQILLKSHILPWCLIVFLGGEYARRADGVDQVATNKSIVDANKKEQRWGVIFKIFLWLKGV